MRGSRGGVFSAPSTGSVCGVEDRGCRVVAAG
jgi:hypothetical protein